MAARALHPSRLAILVVFLGLVAAGCTPTSDDVSPADTAPTTLAVSAITSSEVQSTSEISSPATKATTNTTAPLSLDTPIPEGSAVIIPDGSYTPGQQVTLLFRDDVDIDLLNGSPRLCARVNEGNEVCDPSRLQTQVLSDAPAGTQGVTVEVPQRHFGPAGEHDCGEETMQCRLIWMSETGQALAGPTLTYSRALDPSPLTLEATLGPEVGVATIRLQGFEDLDPGDLLSAQTLESFEDSVDWSGHFDPKYLEVTLEIGALCGFGVGDPPIGSKELVDPPVWWGFTSLVGGPNCDWLAVEGYLEDEGSGESTIRLQRNIYGYGGWQDCATETCYLEVVVSWRHPLPDGSELGGEMAASRVLIDMPDTWPSVRPSINILEPGPYAPGEEVTVEVRDYPYETGKLGIAFCSGAEYGCGFQSAGSTDVDGFYRVNWQIDWLVDGCEPKQCYFAIDSRSEGLAPPAIVIVPISLG